MNFHVDDFAVDETVKERIGITEMVATTRVTGSHVDIRVRLQRAGKRLNYTVIVVTGALLFWVGLQIWIAFASGRVAQILESYR